jgi:hypothetical protein
VRRTALLLLVGLALVFSACGRDRGSERVPLDGSPRVPDAEGIVEAVSREKLTLAGGRTYRIGDELQSFSSQTMEAVPVRQRTGQFVHIGVDGERLVWIAAIGSVVPGDDPVVYYTGKVTSVADGRVTFDDGTVLRLAKGVDPAVTRGAAVAEIEPGSGKVRVLRAP